MRLHEIVNCVNGYKKIRNAIDSCAQGMLLQDVILLIDNTVFGSAKEGMRLTKRHAYAKNADSSGIYIALTDVETFDFDGGMNNIFGK
jgi:hypothetical protein